jgi:hypothetical protein
MNRSIKVVKRGRVNGPKRVEGQSEKVSGRQNTREIVTTVKKWIADLEVRHRREELMSSALLK